MPVDVHPRSQKGVHFIFDHLYTGKGVKFFHKLCIKGAGKKGAVGQAESLHAAVKAHPRRPVGTASAGNPIVFQALGNTAKG